MSVLQHRSLQLHFSAARYTLLVTINRDKIYRSILNRFVMFTELSVSLHGVMLTNLRTYVQLISMCECLPRVKTGGC